LWNFLYHQDLKLEVGSVFYLVVAILCAVVGIGLLKIQW
jgi:hypothetical protein